MLDDPSIGRRSPPKNISVLSLTNTFPKLGDPERRMNRKTENKSWRKKERTS
jgi:hypothetical protein